MKGILTIFKKEFSRVFKDKRLVFSAFILPGLMIYVLYSIMGGVITDMTIETINHNSIIETINAPDNFNNYFASDAIYTIKTITSDELEIEKAKILTDEVNLIIVFDEDFENKALNSQKPSFKLYFNSNSEKSVKAYNIVNFALENYKSNLVFSMFGDTNIFGNPNLDIVTDEDKASGLIVGSMMPFLIIIFLFSGAMSMAPESIAGEKERGTIQTLLITPVKRSEIAIGKIVSLSGLSAISALSSFIGILASMPKLFEGADASVAIYGVIDYTLIFFILVTTVSFIVACISIVSAFAKTVKEASLYVMPLYGVTMIIGVFSMFQNSANSNAILYFIPLYNAVQSLSSIFIFDVSIVNILITISSNILYTLVLVFVLSKMFNSEKIMFQK